MILNNSTLMEEDMEDDMEGDIDDMEGDMDDMEEDEEDMEDDEEDITEPAQPQYQYTEDPSLARERHFLRMMGY